MEVKMKGWPQATLLYLTVILCFFAGFLNAGPLQGTHRTKGHHSVVSSWHHTPTSHHGYHAPTLTASKEVSVRPSHDIVPSHSSVNTLSTLERRDSDPEKIHHNYAIVCGDKDYTGLCRSFGYSCNSKGKVTYTEKISFCDICRCQNLLPAPNNCILHKAIKQCSGKTNMVVNATTGGLPGNGSDLTTGGLPGNGSDLTTGGLPGNVSDLERRDVDPDKVHHNYALVCDDKDWTSLCRSIGYSCSSSGRVTYTQKASFCDDICRCQNLLPAPKNCIVHNAIKQCSGVTNMVVNATTGGLPGNGSGLARRDADADKAHHNYALVCDDREWTTMCQSIGYSCSSSGKVMYKSKDILCDDICKCQNLLPGPQSCLVNKAIKQCSVVDNMVLNATTGGLLGNVSDASILPNGTLDLTTAIAKRDTGLSHDQALVCYDRTLTGLCQASAHGYYCNALGKVQHKGQAETACEDHCTCVNINPKPCILLEVKYVPCGVKHDTVFDTVNGTVIGNLSDAQVLANGSLSFTSTKALAKRHNYGLICQDRENTARCGSKAQYYCTSKGALNNKGAINAWCEENCFCWDIAPSIQCFPNAALLTTCLTKGKMVYTENGTFLGEVSDAYTYPNGTLDFRKVVTRDLAAVSADPYHIICKSPQQPTQVYPAGGLLFDKNLTTFCATHGYSCTSDPGRASSTLTLQPGSEDIKACDNACECPSPTWKRQGSEFDVAPTPPKKPSPTPSLTIQDILLYCDSNDGIVKGKWSFNWTLTEYCKNQGYSCAIEPGPAYVLQRPKDVVAICQAGCACPPSKPLVSAIPLRQKPRARAERRSNGIATVPSPFGMTCSSSPGSSDESLTDHCREEGYSCVAQTDTVLRTLVHSGTDVPECTHSCRCPSPFEQHSRQMEMSATEDESPDSTAVAPPSGVPSQSSSPFALNCGNVPDGPSFCQQSDLGYFCGYNMTVMRTSTVQNQGVTWCDYYCSCIFKHPVPCVNEWNIPLCRELPDGTIRDASNTTVVLGYIEDAVILPNNSILLDRGQAGGFPFVAASASHHGHWHGSNDTSQGHRPGHNGTSQGHRPGHNGTSQGHRPGHNGTGHDSGDSPRWTDWPMNGTANGRWNRTGRADE
ncbi:uncharacterized protein Z520_05424 [Fonsecaea multimorphosa CBS 102226]|uniref:Uncharacterized protein n=1 Tax=Fonsecaea multimorphosa CBS 102226 TaxID=1442371 RepID=A0A0D2KQK7_9EURO|nr:uncharacterized protein Z520_05424 [Fonsecaea multimorphosa CBS 102226]KIX98963.1 hypothetical protein Z520_05424 [Fonsecaea multimorphosa CBS 102226]OAL25236.1 hypothetical protein AYO22_05113 [Fonsecaea multimorphosa]